MLVRVSIIAAAVLFVLGVLLYPRPNPHVSPRALIVKALATKQPATVPVAEAKRRLAAGCTPILEGSDKIDGAEVWAVRLKIPPPAKYPWMELWIDKKTSTIRAWKEWGRRDGRVIVLAQYPDSH